MSFSGVGKTSLCRRICQKTEVYEELFDKQIWICVSHGFAVEDLLNKMANQVDLKMSVVPDIVTAIIRLQHELSGKKYLLVLDDVWSTLLTTWEALRDRLLDIGGIKGTTILVTSRSSKLVDTLIRTNCDHTRATNDPSIYELKILKEEDGWSLFEQRMGDHHLSDLDKVDIGRKLLGKCKGVPLAIKALVNLLYSKQNIEKWREIEGSSIWNEEDEILPSIKLSFNYLPSVWEKRCFAYCGIFQEDEVIEKDRLIQLWMSQGFLQPHDTMEQCGEEYFQTLLEYSLFQDVKFDRLGNVESCKMHDVVSALARVVLGKKICFSMPEDKSINDVVRHISLDSTQDLSMKFGNLWTLFESSGSTTTMKNMTSSKFLRTLSIVSVGLVELPDSIGELKLLRFLDISGNKMIKILPDGLTELHNLQTLRVFAMEVPVLPKEFSNLVNLRHLCCDVHDDIGIPANLGMMTCLQTLPSLNLCDNVGGRISELGTLKNLKGRLKIEGLENVESGDATKVNLGTKNGINELILSWSHSNKHSPDRDRDENYRDEEVLEALQPHHRLARLEMKGYPVQVFPQWVMAMRGHGGSPLRRLESLSICKCNTLLQLPSLKDLQALKTLIVQSCDELVSPLHLEHLTSLQELRLKNLGKLRNISSNDHGLQSCKSLQILILRDCKALENLTDITPLVNLEILEIVNCKQMTRLPAGISNLMQLKRLKVGPFSPELEIFPFPDDMSHLSKSLKRLTIDAKGMVQEISLPNQVQHLLGLKHLKIKGLDCLKALQGWLGNLTSLRNLTLRHLPYELPPSIGPLEKLVALRRLKIRSCKLTLLSNLKCFSSLRELQLYDCDGLETIPDLGCLSNLCCLQIGGKSMTCWEAAISNLPRLFHLAVGPLRPDLDAFPFPNDTSMLPRSLRKLELDAQGMNNITSLPDQIQHIPDLKFLQIKSFRRLEALPEWLGNMTSLQFLMLDDLPLVTCLPSQAAMARLVELKLLGIDACPRLKEACHSGTGSEWHKIEHVGDVEIN